MMMGHPPLFRRYVSPRLFPQYCSTYRFFTDTVLNGIRMARPVATEADVIGAAQMAGCDGFIRALPSSLHEWDTALRCLQARCPACARRVICMAAPVVGSLV